MQRFLLISILFPLSCFAHPLHYSITNIDIYNDSVVVVIKVFTDDFTNHLNQINNTNYAADYYYSNQAVETIQTYINSSFQLLHENGMLLFSITSVKNDELSTRIYLKSLTQCALTKFLIKNKIMLDCFSDQNNLIIINADNQQLGLQLNINKWVENIQL